MSEQAALRPGLGTFRRLEFFTDGVFAIVMTIIVLEVGIPEGPAAQLWAQLGERLPELGTYALTFVTLGALWFGNRTQGEFLERADHPLVWLVLALLLTVALVPFSAGLLGEFPTARPAVVFFGAHLTVVYMLHALVWTYASGHPGLLRDGVPAGYRRRSRLYSWMPAGGYALATLLGLAVPVVGLAGFLLVPVPLVSGLFYRGWGGCTTGSRRRSRRERAAGPHAQAARAAGAASRAGAADGVRAPMPRRCAYRDRIISRGPSLVMLAAVPNESCRAKIASMRPVPASSNPSTVVTRPSEAMSVPPGTPGAATANTPSSTTNSSMVPAAGSSPYSTWETVMARNVMLMTEPGMWTCASSGTPKSTMRLSRERDADAPLSATGRVAAEDMVPTAVRYAAP
ncbi:DUF1211 domain-containing protein [Xylanimonas allomyrinae]|uniref:DUF1211 domain-containing protein n=1 Tax=Xylanimonas allomyrinae TaxID=2509459 RepID=A0A4P6EJE5_9MICO|nr:DUF1211 domain-containing protein [Xylanimonas allomyrinae]